MKYTVKYYLPIEYDVEADTWEQALDTAEDLPLEQARKGSVQHTSVVHQDPDSKHHFIVDLDQDEHY